MNHHDHHHHTPANRPTPPDRGERNFLPEWPDGDGAPPFGRGRGGPRGHRGGPGPDGPWGGGRRGRGPRARGDVRAAILLLLEEQPRHGYELIQEIAERSSGAWSPSPGSIYPTLQVLEDEGLVTIESVEGRRTASLTTEGAAYVSENRERLGTPWTSPQGDHGPALALRQEIMALKDAAVQMARVGTAAQHTAAAAVLVTARKELYRILAEDTQPRP
ncbi:PadR family transcriptional regulator [Cellulomonas sp. KRMCY2]|uniref:PadR family transcriptional regulator n=1 Tax=Cellulomonas sp. KRMCY2 TaxID=1304865 RepID=UPI00045E7AA7|nr:PadR family transcriptional regulator [Cellulomonas sp. KRMCY2]